MILRGTGDANSTQLTLPNKPSKEMSMKSLPGPTSNRFISQRLRLNYVDELKKPGGEKAEPGES